MFRKTVSSVLKTFSSAIADLEAIASRETDSFNSKMVRSIDLETEASAHLNESKAALVAAGNIRSLIGE